MFYFESINKYLKRVLKGRKAVTAAVVVSFLISGEFSIPVKARDLRIRNNIEVSNKQGPQMLESENGTDVINILNPQNGISHNKYNQFNVEDTNNVIFNNSKKDGTSILGGKVEANPNLSNSANIILNEVEGNAASYLNGRLEVFGKKADLIIANENGIFTNGANFINTSATTLSTGKVSVNQNQISLDTSIGNGKIIVNKNGIRTDGDYLNLISNTMKINGNVNSEDNMNTNINLISGENKVIFNGSESSIEEVGSKVSDQGKVSISASYLGSMYGRNVNIVSTKEGVGVEYDGLISTTDDILVDVNGKLSTNNLKAKNIIETSNKEILNKGNMEAKENIILNAPVVKNISTLKGKVQIKDIVSNQKLIDRDRGAIYYDYHLNIHNLEEVENTLNLKKARMTAKNNIIINNDLKDASFENIGGDIHAGNTLNIKGNLKTLGLSKNIKIEDILKKIKVDLKWEHRSLVNNAYFNGRTTLAKGNLLDALKIMTEKKNKEYYDSLKQIKDPTLNKLLSSYLGADWKLQDSIKAEESWNKKAIIELYSKKSSNIKAKNIKFEGKNIKLGNKKENIDESLLVNGEKVETKRANFDIKENMNVVAENFLVKAENFNNSNTNITTKNNLLITSENNIDIMGSELKGKNVLLDAKKETNIISELGYDEAGNEVIAKKSILEAENGLGLRGREINLLGSELGTKENGTIAINSNSLTAKDLKTIRVDYNAEMIEGTGKILKDHKYIKATKANVNSFASIIKGDTVAINTIKDIKIEGSLISGNNENSNIFIQSAGNIDIENTDSIAYLDYISDARGKNAKGRYKLLSIDKNNKKTVDVVKSILESEGNIYIQSKNLNVKASEINAKKNIELKAEKNLNILATLDKTKEEKFSSKWGSGLVHTKHLTSDKEEVNSSSIKSGNKIKMTGKILNNVSSEIEGASIDMLGKEALVNSAISGKIKTSETKVDIGVHAGASVGFAGMGASASVDTIDDTKETKVSSLSGLLADNNEFKKAHLKGNMGSNLEVNRVSKESDIYKNNIIKATEGNINMTSEGAVDIGNTDLSSKRNINVLGSEIITTTKENIMKDVTHKANIGINGDIDFSNETVTKVNGLVNDAVALKNIATLETGPKFVEAAVGLGKNAKKFIESVPGIPKKDIVGINADESISVRYDNTTKKATKTSATNIASGGKVSIIAKTGDVTLKNTNIRATEVSLNAEENINLVAGEKKVHEEKNGFGLGVHATEDVGVNIVDGATAKIGLGGNADYHGATNLSKESMNTSIVATTIEKDAKKIVEDDKISSHYNDERKLGFNVEAKIGVSSNHVLTADGTVGGNVKYSFDGGKTTETVAGEKESFNIKGGATASANIETSGENPDFSIGTEEFELKKDKKVVLHLDSLSDVITKGKFDKLINKVKEKKDEE